MRFLKQSRTLCTATLLLLAITQASAQDQAPPAVTVTDRVESAYRWGDFAELERLYAQYGKAGVRSELTGTPRVEHFWKGIGAVNDSNLRVTDRYYEQLDALTKQWADEHPESVIAQLLYAQSLNNHAWVHRGNGYANTVSPAAWAEFHRYLDLALAQLMRTKALAAKDSSWNTTLLDIGRSLDWDTEHLLPVFADGIAKNPDHDALYFSMLTALTPKWGGSLASVDRFIALAVKNTQEKRGMEMYARLYAGLSYTELKQALFTNSRASWTSMKIGFDDRLKRYPHADHRNMYAYFACMANDRPVLQEQLELMGDKFEPIFWGDNPERTFEECKKMAQQL